MDPDNPEGFFEPKEMVAINDELLARRGGAWLDPPRAADSHWDAPDLEDLRVRAKIFLARGESDHSVRVFKDPRLCLTLAFWAPLLGDWTAVLSLRQPSAVCDSLNRRNALGPNYSLWLWAWHFHRALLVAEEKVTAVLFYEDLMADPAIALTPLVEALRLDLAPPEVRARLHGIVNHALDHASAKTGTDPFDLGWEALRQGPRHKATQIAALKTLLEPVLARAPERLSSELLLLARLKPEVSRLGQELDALRMQNAILQTQLNSPMVGTVLKLNRLAKTLRDHHRK